MDAEGLLHRRGLIAGVLLGELLIGLLLITSAWFQYAREEDRVIRQSHSRWGVVAEEAALYFSAPEVEPSLASVRRFRDQVMARTAPWLNETRESFDIYLESLLGQHAPNSAEAYDVLISGQRTVRRDGDRLFVAEPFTTPDGAVRGLLWIEHDRGAIARATLLDPAWLSFQAVLFVLLSSQLVLTCVVLARRNRTIVFEKGYLKDHAVGALKLQHRLLGQIIRDHESDGESPVAPRVEVREPGKVIPFDRALRRSSEDEGPAS